MAARLFAITVSSLSSAALVTVATLTAIPKDAHAKSAIEAQVIDVIAFAMCAGIRAPRGEGGAFSNRFKSRFSHITPIT
jgi:hypothetical protein